MTSRPASPTTPGPSRTVTGAAELDTESPGGVVKWLVDSTFTVRGAEAAGPLGGTELKFKESAKTPWRSLIAAGPEETVEGLGFTDDAAVLMVAVKTLAPHIKSSHVEHARAFLAEQA